MADLTNQSPWWRPDRHRDRRPFLLVRGRIQRAIRRWFEVQGFVEVETSILQVSPGNETHLHAFATELISPGGERSRRYLHTSPEFACKKLLAAGEERIFTFAPVFRNRERGALHHPAFTMLEWYRMGEPYEVLMEDCAALLRIAAAEAGSTRFFFRGREVDPFAPPDRLTVVEACRRLAGVDLAAILRESEDPIALDPEPLIRAANAAGIRTAPDDTWGDVFSRILVERIEPNIGNDRATLLTEYPAQQAALARPKPGDARVAERFELFACGVELANAFGELTDAALQRRRLEAEMVEKQRLYGERYPLDEDFLAAVACMPPASGAALGFDRLVMLATGANTLDQVIWTPVPDAL
ncbi:MAG TPA: EF-P lysine aminoacylase EpmA [Hyphomicrobiaceae bacterium]|nr:EF-P lysine aminoacylase EpmA [Hyphomicrobiaceae bacterium]